MNKKRRRKGRRTQLPWVLLALGAILIVIAAALLQSPRGGAPAITVDQRQIDYGEVKFNSPRTFAIKISNTGSGPLRFREAPYIEVLEGC